MSQKLQLNALKVTHLKGVGARMSERLAKVGVRTVQDLLFHLPRIYQDRTRIRPVASLQDHDWAVIDVSVMQSDVRFGKRRSFQCQVSDVTGKLTLIFFNFNAHQQQQLTAGTTIRCFGQVRVTAFGRQMVHPEYDVLKLDEPPADANTLTPIYPSTDGIGQKQWQKLTEQALSLLHERGVLEELIPESLRRTEQIADLATALQYLHRPPTDADTKALEAGKHPFQQRLAFEELLAHQCAMLRLRDKTQQVPAPSFAPDVCQQHYLDDFFKQLPFQCTNAQRRVIDEVLTDLCESKPMLRLVQGDVGAGKTVIAAAAALRAVEAGYQVALMAPTEILAEQHFQTLRTWCEPLNVRCAWLTGKLNAGEKREVSRQIAEHAADICIGTHALFQDSVNFAKLGLCIIDEQHRFGVHQRLALCGKGQNAEWRPHQLIMTATPIPRTLAMTAYADLDCSILDELPPGRTPVTTVVLNNQKRQQVIERIRAETQSRRQTYWVCPLIEESEVLQCQAAEEAHILLQQELPNFRIGLIHGRLKPAEKEAIMHQFKAAELDVLVATTVIEVGVDVPNASLMVIENAERLGLSQLHQLRGRVGRGSAQSFCVLLYQAPLGATAKTRLNVMRESNDGFFVAEQDLALRGPGEVLGTRQTGVAAFKMADCVRDQGLVAPAQQAALQLVAETPERVEPLIQRWLPRGVDYANV